MEKEPCTKFCGVLFRFHEVIKLQSFEFGLSDVITANVQNISPLVFFAFFVGLLRKNLKSYALRSPLKVVSATFLLVVSLFCMSKREHL